MTEQAQPETTYCEPWLDKRGLANHLACSIRSIENALAEGMPHATIFGRIKFHVSDVEPWLEEHGHLELAGDRTTINGETQNGPAAPKRMTGP
jgi:hypothetical protein